MWNSFHTGGGISKAWIAVCSLASSAHSNATQPLNWVTSNVCKIGQGSIASGSASGECSSISTTQKSWRFFASTIVAKPTEPETPYEVEPFIAP